MRKWRKMTWVIHITNALFLIWIIGGIASRPSQDCIADQYLSKADCQNASDTGTALGIIMILFFWFLVFIVEALIWFMTKPKEQIIVMQHPEAQ